MSVEAHGGTHSATAAAAGGGGGWGGAPQRRRLQPLGAALHIAQVATQYVGGLQGAAGEAQGLAAGRHKGDEQLSARTLPAWRAAWTLYSSEAWRCSSTAAAVAASIFLLRTAAYAARSNCSSAIVASITYELNLQVDGALPLLRAAAQPAGVVRRRGDTSM